MTASSPDHRHKEYPKRCAPDDFWGQVSRTVNGQPVTEDQIEMIVAAIREQLSLTRQDVVLDLGCGNGALASYFFHDIRSYFGVDFSKYLIEVARANFTISQRTGFCCRDAAQYCRTEPRPERFTKALCYGAFSYLSRADASDVLSELARRFENISRVFIGNLPDRDRAEHFYKSEIDYRPLLDDRTAAIGIWRTREDFRRLAAESGWGIHFHWMPQSFYGAHYRYDVVLHRPAGSKR